MTKEELEFKIKLIETNIELTKEIMEFNKKSDREIVFISLLTFVGILCTNMGNTNFGIIHIFFISLFATSICNMLEKISKEKMDNKLKLKQLEIKLSYYKELLKHK